MGKWRAPRPRRNLFRMLDLPLVAFDIETTPDPAAGRAGLGLVGDDATVIREMMRLRSEETAGRTEYPAQPWHRIICVCATWWDPSSGEVRMENLGSSDPWDEAAHVRGFFDLVEGRSAALGGDRPVRLFSWNGGGFDLPILRYRAMRHGIVAREFQRQDGDRRYNNYLNRFHDLHVDLMDVLSSYGAAPRAGLGAIAAALGLPSKEFLELPIHEHLLRGDAQRIIEYCKLDTLTTLLVALRWGHHAGWLSGDQLRSVTDSLQALVDREPYEGWRGLAADGLRGSAA